MGGGSKILALYINKPIVLTYRHMWNNVTSNPSQLKSGTHMHAFMTSVHFPQTCNTRLFKKTTTLAGFDLMIHSSSLLGGRGRLYHYVGMYRDHATVVHHVYYEQS
jgi:hypothetical protein